MTPQFLFYQEFLSLVDWETIAIYTCPNQKCLPDVASEDFYAEEFAFIQFSEDFSQVQFGTDDQIRNQKASKTKQDLQAIVEEEPDSSTTASSTAAAASEDEEAARRRAEKNRKKREKQK